MSVARKLLLPALLLAFVVAAPGAAHADPEPLQAKPAPPAAGEWTLAEREHWALMEKEIAQYVDLLNARCETKITASFDKETFRGKLMEPGKTGLAASRFWQSATESVGTLRNLCIANATAKGAVKTKVTKVVIQHAGGTRAHQLAGGTVTAVVDTAANPREWQTQYQEFLKQKL
jgi:hypothetical protein